MEVRKITQNQKKNGGLNTKNRAARVAARVTAKIALAKGATLTQALSIQRQLSEALSEDTYKTEVKTQGTLHCIASVRADLCRKCEACTLKLHCTR